ncbi:MAG: Gfo/Idh/MocA family oxidoreductase [bacterium]|nr:Gfo/Idh/MocA family oxidoreductase [bacterium]
MSIKVGIIGCGGIARQHVIGYTGNDAVVTAVTDYSPEAAAGLAKETGEAGVYEDYRQLIDEAGVQAVSICTPPVAHEAAAIYALEHGVHVLCEKPMAYDIPSAHRIRAAAGASSALFMPAFRHRFLPAAIAFKELVASGRIGDVVLFNNIFCGPAFQMEGKWFTQKKIAGGGSLLDTNSHSVDLFRFIVGEIAERKAVMHRHFKTTDVEDAGILSVKAENGAVGTMQSSFVAGSGAAFIDIIGTKGRAVYDYTDPERLRWRLTQDTDWSEEPVTPSGGFGEEITHFLGAVRGEHPLSHCTIEDGVRCMEVICSVYDDGGER